MVLYGRLSHERSIDYQLYDKICTNIIQKYGQKMERTKYDSQSTGKCTLYIVRTVMTHVPINISHLKSHTKILPKLTLVFEL